MSVGDIRLVKKSKQSLGDDFTVLLLKRFRCMRWRNFSMVQSHS